MKSLLPKSALEEHFDPDEQKMCGHKRAMNYAKNKMQGMMGIYGPLPRFTEVKAVGGGDG